MAFNVREMLSTINANGGLAKSSKFMVDIVKAPVPVNKDVSFFCDATNLPGITYQTDDIRMSGYGNIEKRPYATIFQDLQLEFYCDSDGRVFNFFHKWAQAVYNFNGRTPVDGATNRGLIPNSFDYPSNYFGTIEITQYRDSETGDGEKRPIIKYTVEEVYPITLTDVQVSWEQSDQLLKLPVTFAYTFWSAETLDQGTVDNIARTRGDALQSQQTRIDNRLNSVREAIGITSPTQRNRLGESLIDTSPSQRNRFGS